MINEFKLPTRHIQSLLSNTSTKNININATWNHFMIDRIPPMAHNRTQYSLVQQSHSHNNWVVEQSLTSEWPATGPVTCVTTCVLHVQSSSDHHQGSAVCLSVCLGQSTWLMSMGTTIRTNKVIITTGKGFLDGSSNLTTKIEVFCHLIKYKVYTFQKICPSHMKVYSIWKMNYKLR